MLIKQIGNLIIVLWRGLHKDMAKRDGCRVTIPCWDCEGNLFWNNAFAPRPEFGDCTSRVEIQGRRRGESPGRKYRTGFREGNDPLYAVSRKGPRPRSEACVQRETPDKGQDR